MAPAVKRLTPISLSITIQSPKSERSAHLPRIRSSTPRVLPPRRALSTATVILISPSWPLRRLSALDHDDPKIGRYLELYGRMNSIALYRSIQGQLRRLVRELRSPAAGCGGIPPPPAAEPVSGSETKHGLCNRSVSPHLKEAVCS